jgi:hypothetical protein
MIFTKGRYQCLKKKPKIRPKTKNPKKIKTQNLKKLTQENSQIELIKKTKNPPPTEKKTEYAYTTHYNI